MKRLLLRVFVLLLVFPIFIAGAQAPYIGWEKCLGGPYIDYGGQVMPTTDGGSIAVGYVSGNGGDVVGFQGQADYWVVKQDVNGAIQWSVCLGGAWVDYGTVVRQTADGGYLVGGEASSPQGSGNVTTSGNGGLDAWLVKLSSLGSIQWEKNFGGSGNEYVGDIKPTADGGYILAGSTQAFGTTPVPGNHGDYDMWLMKLNSNGSMAWQKCIGGSSEDWGYGVTVASDGYVIVGWTDSPDGDSYGNFGSHDMLVAKVDLSGNMNWARPLGGSGYDEGYGVEAAPDGSGYLCAGLTRSNDGFVSGNHGSTGWQDAWVVKMGPGGNLLWQHCYGGGYNESAWSITGTADGGFLVAGSAQSLDGDVSCLPPHIPQIGTNAGWVFKITSGGALAWDKVISGDYYDFELYAKEAPDGSILVCGYTGLSDVPGYHTDVTNTVGDIYVGKLVPPSALALSVAAPAGSICAGANFTLTANFVGPATAVTYHWFKNGVDQGVNAATFSSSAFANGDIVYCEAIIANGTCTVGQTVTSNSVQLSVSSVLAPQISISAGGPVTVCAGTEVDFNANVTGGTAGGTYQWSVSGVASGSGAAFSSTTLREGDVVTCVYSDNAACMLSGQIASNAITVHVNPVVDVAVRVTADTLRACAGSAVHFTAAGSGGGSAPVYAWMVNGAPVGGGGGLGGSGGGSGSGVSGAFGQNFSSTTLGNGDVVSCMLISSAACATPATATSNVFTVAVLPVMQSAVGVAVSPAVICSGEPVAFSATAQNAGTTPVYAWMVNGAPVGGGGGLGGSGGGSGSGVSGAFGQNFSSTTLGNGDVVSCTVSDAAQCVIASSDAVTVRVNPTPVVGTAGPLLVSKGQSVALDLPVSGDIATYVWSPGTGLDDSTLVSPLATPLQTTDYHLTVTTAAGCSDTGSILVKVFSHISIPGAFTPNGDGHNDIFYVKGGPIGSRIADLAVYDRYGEIVFAVHGVAPDDPAYGWNGMINGQQAPTGVYVYVVRLQLADGSQQVFKGVVMLVR